MHPYVFLGVMLFAYVAINYLVMDLTMRYLIRFSDSRGRPVSPDWSKADRASFDTMALCLKNAIVVPVMCVGLWALNNSGYAERVMSDDTMFWFFIFAATVFIFLVLMYRTAYTRLFGKSPT